MIRFPLIAKSLPLLLTLASSGPASAVWMFPDGTYKLSFQASGFVSQIDGLPRDETVSGYITFTSAYDAMLDITMPTVIDADVRVEGQLYDESEVLSGFGWPGETLSFGAGGRGHAIDAADDIWLRFTPRTSLVEFRYVTSAGEDNLASVVTSNFAPVPEPTGGALTASVLIAAGLVMARKRPALGAKAPT